MTQIQGTQIPTAEEYRKVLQREWESVSRVLADLSDQDWNMRTRCAGWSILDLGRHVVWGVSMEADALRRARTGKRDPADGTTMADDSRPQEILTALHSAVADLDAEMQALGPDSGSLTCPMPYGEVPLPAVLDIYVFEAGYHASDFAHAVGEDRPLAADVVPSTAAVMAQFLPVFAAGSTSSPPVGTSFALKGEAVSLDGHWSTEGLVMGEPAPDPTVTVTGDDSAVLLFAAGRLGADDQRLSVDGSTDLARDFKAYVPGP
jgi:uncharacterized protein (TIGR03083 family)